MTTHLPRRGRRGPRATVPAPPRGVWPPRGGAPGAIPRHRAAAVLLALMLDLPLPSADDVGLPPATDPCSPLPPGPDPLPARRAPPPGTVLRGVPHHRADRECREAPPRPCGFSEPACYVDVGRGARRRRGCVRTSTPGRSWRTRGWSTRPSTQGVMHACGHDIHTTVMLGVARVLAAGPLLACSRYCADRVPAAEEAAGGAKHHRCRTCWQACRGCRPALRAEAGRGQVGTRIGAITSASIRPGSSRPGAADTPPAPHGGPALVAMSQIAIDVPAALSRRVDVRSGVAVVPGQIHAGFAPNAIPMSGFMAGTTRRLDAGCLVPGRRC
ncbi:hypothetical protein QJS66_08655 [Kocuria rhizophila]|nr:hypothetical protein QJS66_08655 [Kocuria rhizophila]